MHKVLASRSHREWLVQIAWAALDSVVVILAAYLAAWIRFDLDIREANIGAVAVFAALAVVVHLIGGFLIGPYRVGHKRGSFEETADIARGGAFSMAVLALAILPFEWLKIPRSLPFTAPFFAVAGMFALRFIIRSYRWGQTASPKDSAPVIIYGAGNGGRQLIRALQSSPPGEQRYFPVAVLDDDPRKRRLKIDGVRVRGGRSRIAAVAEQTGARTLVIAMPSAGSETITPIRQDARAAGLQILVMPHLNNLLSAPRAADLRQLNLEDLLGRGRVELDAEAIMRAINGKRVLVTGAGGSIGAELCRQLQKFTPAKLVLLDRDESALHGTQMSMTGRALLDDGTLALCDIRDPEALRAVFEREQPEVVFHAAALKHLTLLEQYPLEGWKSNVLGTLNVLNAAHAVAVETFVNISTDKAANPSCVLGYSKRIAERLTAGFAGRGGGTYVSVRFGNVLGSRGSVITAFTAQIERGGPVTVTHPDVERYFMLIPEACQLVLQAAAIGHQGEVMVLEMGTPVKIVEVAKTLIELSGKDDVEIVYTGLRPGEKMSEELFTPGEHIQSSEHPLVNHVVVPAIAQEQVLGAPSEDASESFLWMLRESGGHTDPELHPELSDRVGGPRASSNDRADA